MKRIKKLSLILVLLMPLTLQAQDWEDVDVEDPVPLDDGLNLLAAGGIAYGAKKWHELKKVKEQ